YSLKNHARNRRTADQQHLLVVLLQLLDERQKIAVPADDDVGVDVRVGERHLQRIQRQIDVSAVLVTPWRQVALNQADGVLCQRAAVLPGARPVGISTLGADLTAVF